MAVVYIRVRAKLKENKGYNHAGLIMLRSRAGRFIKCIFHILFPAKSSSPRAVHRPSFLPLSYSRMCPTGRMVSLPLPFPKQSPPGGSAPRVAAALLDSGAVLA